MSGNGRKIIKINLKLGFKIRKKSEKKRIGQKKSPEGDKSIKQI